VRARRLPPERPVGFDGKSPAPLVQDEHSEEEIERYLEELRQGVGLQLAARNVGSTATRMRRFGLRDPGFASRVAEAVEQGGDEYRDRLRNAARLIALRTDPGEVNSRILEVELATHGGDEYAHLRRDRVRHEGHVTHALTVRVDPEFLDALPDDELQRRRDALAVLSEQEQQLALPPAPAA